jgi:hypothetical protein
MLQDFSQYMLDIAENSLKADTTRVDIAIEEDTSEKTLCFTVSNNGALDGPQSVFHDADVLVTGWPDRDFSFRYANDEGHFSVSTEELVAILKDRSFLATPKTA